MLTELAALHLTPFARALRALDEAREIDYLDRVARGEHPDWPPLFHASFHLTDERDEVGEVGTGRVPLVEYRVAVQRGDMDARRWSFSEPREDREKLHRQLRELADGLFEPRPPEADDLINAGLLTQVRAALIYAEVLDG